MKNAAKCDTYCELQDSVNHQIFERILRSLLWIDHAWLSLFKQPSLSYLGENIRNTNVMFFGFVYRRVFNDGNPRVIPGGVVVTKLNPPSNKFIS